MKSSLVEDLAGKRVSEHSPIRIHGLTLSLSTTEVNFDVKVSKPTIDKIDQLLAAHYSFTQEELDFIINYDTKYRMGRGNNQDEE